MLGRTFALWISSLALLTIGCAGLQARAASIHDRPRPPAARGADGRRIDTAARERPLTFVENRVQVDARPRLEAAVPLPGHHNYFIGDTARWRTDVRSYGELLYCGIYAGVDLRLYGSAGALEQEFILRTQGECS